MKKTLALILALAMVFSTVTVAFAEEAVVEEVEEAAVEVVEEEVVEAVVSEEAAALATIGMLQGTGDGVTAEYEAEEMTRLIAASALLKLKGLYEEAIEYDGVDNFADVEDYVWEQGKNLMAYLKANPALGFGGDEKGNFNPSANIDEQSYYKVLLETLGYKQTTAEVTEGDFAWDETIEFAESIGLKPAGVEVFTVGDLAKATVSALKAKTKDGKVYIDTLVEAGKVDGDLAVAAGLMEEAPTFVELEIAVDEVKAVGNKVVEVKFKEDVDEAAAGNIDNYEIEGLEIEDVYVVASDRVRLETALMKGGKVYILIVGEEKVEFTGIVKVSGAPKLEKVVSEDIEEVVLEFDKNIDFKTGSDIDNYSIAGVEIVKAEVEDEKVTLTTVGLEARKSYTVKVSNIESVDGGLLKSASRPFYARPDTTAPKFEEVKVDTNQRLIVYFSKEVTKDSAEDVENYEIEAKDEVLEVLDAILITSGDHKNQKVELITEAQTYGTQYELTVSNIVDRKKSANEMTKAATKKFRGAKEDTNGPVFYKVDAVTRDLLRVTFTDVSRIEEGSALDINNYTLTKGDDEFAVLDAKKHSSETGEFVALVTVEELDVSTGYKLEITDVVDEFDNAMKDTSRTFIVKATDISSATVSDIEIKEKNLIVVEFTKPLVKKTAENIANYSIEKNIGAPLKATYKDKDNKYKVELKTNNLVAGKEYTIEIDGVEDLAGNVLRYKVKDQSGDSWAKEPELDDIYVVNRNVIAVVFKDEVKLDGKATMELRKVDAEGEDVSVTLKAKDLVDDDTVVEFSDFELEENLLVAENEDKNVTYRVYSIVSGNGDKITDLTGDKSFTKFNINKNLIVAPVPYENAKVLDKRQVDGITFEIEMSKNVKVETGNDVYDGKWDVTVKDGNIVRFRLNNNTKIEEDEALDLDLNTIIKDMHGQEVINEGYKGDDGNKVDNRTKVEWEFVDEDKPYIVNVVATFRNTIEVEYNEDMKRPSNSAYKVYKIDEDEDKEINDVTIDVDDNKVLINVGGNKFESRYDYKLVIKEAVKDIAGNAAEEDIDDVFYFYGTDLAPLNL